MEIGPDLNQFVRVRDHIILCIKIINKRFTGGFCW